MRRLLVRLYPRSWRHRYGEEFLAVLEQSPLSVAVVVDVVVGAATTNVAHRRQSLAQLAALVVFAAVERYVITRGLSPNIFWWPRTLPSLGLLGVAAGSLALAVAPVVVWVAGWARRLAGTARR